MNLLERMNRRHRAYGLAGLFAFVTVVAVVIGFFVRRYHEWQRLDRELTELGAFVVIRYPCPIAETQALSCVSRMLRTPIVVEVVFHGDWVPPPPPQLAMWSYSHVVCENINDEKLKVLIGALSRLDKCPKISLIGTNVTDEGISELQSLSSLEELNLTAARITSTCLGSLKELRLQSLNVAYTHLSDEDVLTIATLRHLRTLDVSMTNITADGANRLRSQLPNCAVIHDG